MKENGVWLFENNHFRKNGHTANSGVTEHSLPVYCEQLI